MKKTKYVDPMIGTVGDEQAESFHGGGKTHPGACYPFGMMQFSPDTITQGDNGTGYNYCNDTIEGISVNHMSGIGWYGDLGNLQMMPIVGTVDLRSGSNAEVSHTSGGEGWRSTFSHEKECARAGYYSVFLDKYNILAEATVSERCGQLRFTYPKSNASGIILNFSRRIAGRASLESVEVHGTFVHGKIVCNHKDGGFGRGKGKVDYTLYFSLECSKPFTTARFFENEVFYPEDITRAEGEDLHLLLRFPTKDGERVIIRCGISYVDLDGAKRNLKEECPTFDFEGMYERADEAWENALGTIEVTGEDSVDLTLFYTCLYHTLLDPRCATDTDGRTRLANGEIHTMPYRHRTMFSGWDVYRSEFPLLTLISPDTVNDEINSLISIARASNSSFPRWELMGIDSQCMTGDPGTIVLADAYLKGIRNYNIEEAYRIAITSARSLTELNHKRFNNLHPTNEPYIKRAFVSGDLSSTLEYLLCDYALSRLALATGQKENY